MFRLHRNDAYADQAAYPHDDVIGAAGRAAARAALTAWPGYAPTPLQPLPGLAAQMGLGAVWLKDEGGRFGLGSFKALGGGYAVMRVLSERLGGTIGIADLAAGKGRGAVDAMTVCCATDGNHGRAVAWGAGLAGARCVIYLHEHVSEGRERAIAGFGAEIVRVPGTYDDSVKACAAEAAARGWHVVSDTSYAGYMTVPGWIMEGYTVMAEEARDQLGDEAPSHIFVQGGVGGLAAAVVAGFWPAMGGDRARPVVVEPEAADCLFQSARRGAPATATGDLDTVMACLAAAEASPMAWQVLADGAFAFMTIGDEWATRAMRHAAAGEAADPPLVLGESGAAALGGLLAVAGDADARAHLGLDAAARVLVIGSEGATDPEIYQRIVGRPPAAVRSAAS